MSMTRSRCSRCRRACRRRTCLPWRVASLSSRRRGQSILARIRWLAICALRGDVAAPVVVLRSYSMLQRMSLPGAFNCFGWVHARHYRVPASRSLAVASACSLQQYRASLHSPHRVDWLWLPLAIGGLIPGGGGTWRRRLTIHSSRSRFAARLNSGVRLHMNVSLAYWHVAGIIDCASIILGLSQLSVISHAAEIHRSSCDRGRRHWSPTPG